MDRALTALFILVAVVVPAPGCSSEPCLEAADKLDSCLQRLDCRDDPMSMRKCEEAYDKGTEAVEQLRNNPCAAQLRDKADEINSCPVEQVDFCNCFVL